MAEATNATIAAGASAAITGTIGVNTAPELLDPVLNRRSWRRSSTTQEHNMSHRMALALSIALTLVLAGGVVAARDRFFASPSKIDQQVVDLAETTTQPTEKTASSTTNAMPRVIEVTLPAAQTEPNDLARDGAARVRGDDDEREHRGFDDDRNEHEDDDEDDD